MADVVADAVNAAGSEALEAGANIAAAAADAAAAAAPAAAASASTSGASAVAMPALLLRAGTLISSLLCGGALPVRLPSVDECDPLLGCAILVIFLAPFIWNVLGRLEFYTGVLSSLFVRPRIGAAVLAVWIFCFSLYRDAVFFAAVEAQPKLPTLDTPMWHAVAGACGVAGATLVLTSFWRLGFYGTYLGDYFGVLMEEKVEGFPFSVVEHPMYDGSTMLFLAKSILYVACFFFGAQTVFIRDF